jgi:hypothetical protein
LHCICEAGKPTNARIGISIRQSTIYEKTIYPFKEGYIGERKEKNRKGTVGSLANTRVA